MKLTLIDGYVDEPSAFGVPPYISPHARYAAGAALTAGAEVEYLTIDQLRQNPRPLTGDALAVLASVSVPGKYLRGTPITRAETINLFRHFKGHRILFGDNAAFGFADGGGGHATDRLKLTDHVDTLATRDGDAAIRDFFDGREVHNRFRTMDEWTDHAIRGAEVVAQHPDQKHGIVFAEMDTFYGCVHFVSGGCHFCSDAKKKPWYRPEEAIIREAEVLYENGVRHFRLGGQTCFWTYKAHGVGVTDEPRPNVEATERMLAGVHEVAPERKVLHIDNANPAVLATWPDESAAIAQLLVDHGTDGNIAALGLESADPAVFKANNLNCTPEQVMDATRILNKVGGHRGPNGLPFLLPGINLLYGLPGETKTTYELNWKFVEELRASGQLVRRIQIRQLLPIRGQGLQAKHEVIDPKLKPLFIKQKKAIRNDIDRPILREIVPAGTVLRGVFLEKVDNGVTFGRQIASYALLVGIPYEMETEQMVDVLITDHGFRSVTGVPTPFHVPSASLKALAALPGIGRKRAATLKAANVRDMESFAKVLGDEYVMGPLRAHIEF
jgi:radical SAM superfamily enzyme with C-terminal helix-hairpin-helix motif